MGARLLVIEDDSDLRTLLLRMLEEEGFEVTAAANGADALRAIDAQPVDGLVIDIGLPDADGRDICQAIRARGVQAPVLFLTARDGLTDRLSGFRVGGDDYLTKPFAVEELVARLQVLIRRSGVDLASTVGELRLDPATHAAVCAGQTVALTPTEFRILAALCARPGDALRRQELVRVGWPHGAIVHDNTLDAYIARIRRKLRDLPGAPVVATVHGVGYAIR
jgi:two-component system, OmpR family, response regulator